MVVSVLTVLTVVLIVQRSRTPDLHERVFRIGYEDVPPSEFAAQDGSAKGAVIDVMQEAAAARHPPRVGSQRRWFGTVPEYG